MTKNTKILIGVGVVGVGAYLLWKSQQKKSFANLVAPTDFVKKCCGHTAMITRNGNDIYSCCNGKSVAPASDNQPCEKCGSKTSTTGA
jgi:DnaJ-class molecular chaperone